MAVFRELKIRWKGKHYLFTPSNRLLRRIEEEVALTDVIAGIAGGRPKLSHVALVVAEFLMEAGVETAEDDIYAVIMDDIQDGATQFTQWCEVIAQAVSPTEDVAKNSKGSAAAKTARKSGNAA